MNMNKADDLKTDLSVALSDLHMLGYEEGYNSKAIEINKVYMEGNNPLLRQEGTANYLLAQKEKLGYEKRGAEIIARITKLLFEMKEEVNITIVEEN